jgi:cellulose biosynthesis protein BcsQ
MYLTHNDIDKKLSEEKSKFPSGIETVEVWHDSVQFYIKSGCKIDEIRSALVDIFPLHYNPKSDTLKSDIVSSETNDNIKFKVYFEEVNDNEGESILPLWYSGGVVIPKVQQKKKESKSDIVAFYSYSPGIGRSQLLAWALLTICKQHKKKILVIDADVGCPTLSSWQTYSSDTLTFCRYIDAVYNIGDKGLDSLASLCTNTKVNINSEIKSDLFIMPAYSSSVEELIDPPSVTGWKLTDSIFTLANAANFDLVLIDLPSGFDNTASAVLFDSRVSSTLVTDLSPLSLNGTKLALKKMKEFHGRDIQSTLSILIPLLADLFSYKELSAYISKEYPQLIEDITVVDNRFIHYNSWDLDALTDCIY